MKITKEYTEEKRNYSELKVGTCFETSGDVFIKTDIVIPKLGFREIAIRLEDGEDIYFEKDIRVTVLNNVELIIRR